MVTERLDVRLDPERRRKLEELAEHKQVSVSDTVRELIDKAYEDRSIERRLQAVERIANANVEDVPEPEVLSRQLDETYSAGDLY